MNLPLRNIPFSPPDMTEAEIQKVAEALRSGWITTGPKTKEFERKIAAYCGTSKAVCLSSATASMECILRVLGVGPGDEVITSAYTYTASASVVCHVGATLKLVDTAPDSFEMDYDQLANAITERTKVVIPVDLGGVICDYDRVFEAVESKRQLFRPSNDIQAAYGRVIVLADCAHAFGAHRHGKMAGRIGDFTAFSFHAVKNLTTAEGGAVTWLDHEGVDNEALYHQFQLLSLHGQSKDALSKTKLGSWEYDVVAPLYKCNMTDISAAIGLAQFERYPALLERRRQIISRYDAALKVLPIKVLKHYGAEFASSGHLYLTRLIGKTMEERNEFIIEMAKRGIACNVHYKPLPMLTAYKNLGFDIKDYPNAYNQFVNEVTLPLHTCLSDEDVDYVIRNYLEVIQTIPKKRIYLCLAHMSESEMEQKFIQEAFDTNWVVPLGPNVNGFEKDLETFVNDSQQLANDSQLDTRVAALSSGTAAVHLALMACGVGPGDEVIVQSFTFCASSHPITYLGATPIFVDSENDSWNVDPELMEEAIKDRIAKTGKKPKAILPVALYGMPYDIDRIMEIAQRYDIPVIEDAAEGFGSRWNGQVLGTFGKFGVLSFNGNKMITTSGGGALICEDEASKNRILWYATQAREAYPYYQHEAIGYNYRMSNICAGIGRGQMTVANEHIAHHKHVFGLYKELLKDVKGIEVHGNPDGRYDSNYWLNAITIDPNLSVKGQENVYQTVVQGAVGGSAGVVHSTKDAHTDCEPNANVEALRVYLDRAGIEARPLWKPMHKQPVYKDAPAYVNGVSEALFKVGMCLPSGPYVSDEDVRYIVDCIKEAIE